MRIPERLSDQAKAALERAREEAGSRGADFYDVGHILLGILASPECLAWRILSAKGANPSRLRARLDQRLDRYPGREGTVARASLPAKQVLSHAEREAEHLGHSVVGTEHILLGLLSMGEGLANVVLAEAGVRAETTRVWVGEIAEHELRVRHELAPAPAVYPWDALDSDAKSAVHHAIRFARSLNLETFTAMHLVFGLVQALPAQVRQAILERGVDIDRSAEAVSRRLDSMPEPGPDQTMAPDRHAREVLSYALFLAWAHDRKHVHLSHLARALNEAGEDSVKTAMLDSGIRPGDLSVLR